MTTLVQAIFNQTNTQRNLKIPAPSTRIWAITALAIAISMAPNGIEMASSALVDAYLAVSVFVAATLVVLYAAEQIFRSDMGAWLSKNRQWQVPTGALLGGLPGCGGAIVAVTQFSRGRLSFGGVVATLTSTMGDAMFLLLAREPMTAVIVFIISGTAGIITGYIVDAIHGEGFLQPNESTNEVKTSRFWFDGSTKWSEIAWFALFVPGLILGVLAAFQIEFESPIVAIIGVSGSLLALGMWAMRGDANRDCAEGTCQVIPISRKVIDDTNFVSAWVIFAFVGYELLITSSGIDLAETFKVWAIAVPAIAVAIGFIPGCGPQIVTTSLYLDGAIPLSAQLGNAISNDGDALFPAIAKAPKAAALATAYSAIPAIIVAYGAFMLGW